MVSDIDCSKNPNLTNFGLRTTDDMQYIES